MHKLLKIKKLITRKKFKVFLLQRTKKFFMFKDSCNVYYNVYTYQLYIGYYVHTKNIDAAFKFK